jgi:hypothetical protein
VVVNSTGTGLTVSPVAFPGPTGPFLSLGGGTVTGPTTFSNAGTGLTVSNNALVGGTLGVTGAATVGGTLNVGTLMNVGVGAASGSDFVILGPTGNKIRLVPQGNKTIELYGKATAQGLNVNPITFPIDPSTHTVVPVTIIETIVGGTFQDAGVTSWNSITVASDTGTATGAKAILTDLGLVHNFGGAGFQGGRQPLTISMVQQGPVAGTPGVFANIITGLGIGITLNNTFGGAGVTPTTSAGFVSLINPYLVFASGFTNGGGGSITEMDYSRQAGSSFVDFIGLFMTTGDPLDAVQGARDDFGMAFGRASVAGTNLGLKAQFSTGASSGYSGVATNGALWVLTPNLGIGTITVDKGLSWANGTFTTSAIETPGFLLDGSGNVKGLTFRVGSNQVVGARQTGWTAMTGTPNIAAVYDTSTVTLAQLAGRVMALQVGLTTHGLIGT